MVKEVPLLVYVLSVVVREVVLLVYMLSAVVMPLLVYVWVNSNISLALALLGVRSDLVSALVDGAGLLEKGLSAIVVTPFLPSSFHITSFCLRLLSISKTTRMIATIRDPQVSAMNTPAMACHETS